MSIGVSLRAFLLLSVVSVAAPASAQEDYPARDIHAIVGFAAGSGADVIARYFGEQLKQRAGKPVIIENKPGASGALAGTAAAQAKPNGYTIYFTGAASISTNLYLFKTLGYDPVKDFAAVAPLLVQPFILVVDPKAGVGSVAELTARLKQKGDKANYAAPNSTSWAVAELYKAAVGVPTLRIQYRDAASALNDMLAGQIDLWFADPVFALENSRAGRLKALAVTTPTRMAAIPELPTMAEQGMKGIEVLSWWSVQVPTGTPPDIIAKLNRWFTDSVKSEETRKFLATFGADPFPGTPEELRAFHLKEIESWARIAAIAKFEKQ